MPFKSLLESFRMMKANRPRFSTSQSHVTDYELQRLQKLKFNAERMIAQGSGSLANKILQDKMKTVLSLGAAQNDTAEDIDDDSGSDDACENEGETANSMEVDNLTSRKRKVCTQVSKQVKNLPNRPGRMVDFVEMNSQMKEHEQQVVSKKKASKRVFCSPGSMSAYLEFRKRQKENNKDIVECSRPSNNSFIPQIRNDDDAMNENGDYDALNENYNKDALENDDGVENEYGADQELERDVVSQYGGEETGKASKSKKHRGPTMLPKVHARTREERQVIVLNSFGQPVGPTKEIVQEFKLFLGTVARDSELAPLNYLEFPSLPTLDKIWDYVLEKYMVPQAGIDWVMEAINACWKCYKCRIKKNHFYAYPTDALRWANKPDTISKPQFRDLLQYWHSTEAEEISKINKDNRLKLDDMHTMGRKSYAILRHELQQQDPNKQEPSQAKVYKESRKRTAGRTYLSNHEKTEENIAKMDALVSSQHEDGSNTQDPYSEVIPDPKRKSRVRLHGRGVKRTDLIKTKDKKLDFIFPEEFLQSMQAQLVQQLAPSVTTVVLTQLREANPGINLVIPNFVIPSDPKDACSAPHDLMDQNERSKSGAAPDQVNDQLNEDEV